MGDVKVIWWVSGRSDLLSIPNLDDRWKIETLGRAQALARTGASAQLVVLDLADRDLTFARRFLPECAAPSIVIVDRECSSLEAQLIGLGADCVLPDACLDSAELGRAIRQTVTRHEACAFADIALDTMRDGVTITDSEGHFVWLNRAAADMGQAPGVANRLEGPVEFETADGRRVAPKDRPVMRAIRGERVTNELFRVRSRDSETTRWFNVSARPTKDREGRRLAVAVFRDMTGRVSDDARVQRLNTLLEQRVAQRTAALESINKELEAFNHAVSHDLSEPLRAVEGFSQALLEDYGDVLEPDACAYIQRIRGAADKLSKRVDALLDLSRLTRAEPKIVELDLVPLAHTLFESLRARAPERSVELVIPDALPCEGDATLVGIVLENLLGNAFKFTRDTAHAIIELGRLPSGALYVRDNGCGFGAAYAQRIFRPFARYHTQAEYPGSGVGLATVQRIVNRHSGRVWGESTEGQGATFYFTLG